MTTLNGDTKILSIATADILALSEYLSVTPTVVTTTPLGLTAPTVSITVFAKYISHFTEQVNTFVSKIRYSFIAVSYTHLDVYKRQCRECSSEDSSLTLM